MKERIKEIAKGATIVLLAPILGTITFCILGFAVALGIKEDTFADVLAREAREKEGKE